MNTPITYKQLWIALAIVLAFLTFRFVFHEIYQTGYDDGEWDGYRKGYAEGYKLQTIGINTKEPPVVKPVQECFRFNGLNDQKIPCVN